MAIGGSAPVGASGWTKFVYKRGAGKVIMMRKGWDQNSVGAVVGRVLVLIALGSAMAGCDRCGDWWGASDQSQSCKGQLPSQR